MRKEFETYVLGIQLNGLKYEVFRGLAVRGSTTLRELHFYIQAVMGWENMHLYHFVKKGVSHDMDISFADKNLLEEDISATNDDHIHFVCDVFNNPEDKLEYTYDFGDDWHHTITLLKIETNPYEYPALPAMIMAEGVAPPEDCGGVHEVNRILAEATDSTHPNHNESMEWVRENEIMSEPDIPMLVQRLGLSLLDMYDYYADLFKGEEDQDFED